MRDQIKVVFHCSKCRELADELTLSYGTIAQPQLVVDSVVGLNTINLSEDQARLTWQVLLQRDPRALFALNRFWIPCYCPECERLYCKNHWRVEMQFDEDFPGFYDCSYGYCPEHHRRLLDD